MTTTSRIDRLGPAFILNLLLGIALAAYVALTTGTAQPQDVGTLALAPDNAYTWTAQDAEDFPACRKADGNATLSDQFLVVDAWTGGAGTRTVVSFDRATEMAAENEADAYAGNRWNVIGYCA